MSEEQNRLTVGRAVLATEPFQQDTVPPLQFPSLEEYRKKARAELRDRFAMAALMGLLAGPRAYSREERAANAWQEADAILKARGDE